MALVDPTGGIGYSFGQKLPSTHMTTIAANQPKAIDGSGGGTYTPAAPIIINGASALQLGGKLKYTLRTVTRLLSHSGSAHTNDATKWAVTVSDVWRNTAEGGFLYVNIDQIAHNAKLVDLRVRWKGAAGHVGMPGALPAFEVRQIDLDGVNVSFGVVSDTSVSVPAYEAAHSIAATTNFVVDLAAYRYILIAYGETGANFVANAQLLGVLVTMEITEQSEV